MAELIDSQRGPLLARWRQHVRQFPSAKKLDTPALTDHIPDLLDELVEALKACYTRIEISKELSTGSPTMHGEQRALDGFDIEEVVTEYNILRGCIHDLADSNGVVLQGKPFHILNHVFDSAIGSAVRTFSSQRALETQRRREEYLSFVAHDLRTPLTGINLAMCFLERNSASEKNKAASGQMLKVLRRSVKYLDSLVNKVLEENSHLLSESGVKLVCRDVDLWPLIEILRHDLQLQAETGQTQLINAVPEELCVHGDASSLRRIFQNLVANAIHYTPNGTVTIGARELADKNGVECWVSDNGTGIEADRLSKVFDKLETDPENEKGLGLGLAVVKSFVEAHGGQVRVESTLGHGAKFIFTLPVKK